MLGMGKSQLQGFAMLAICFCDLELKNFSNYSCRAINFCNRVIDGVNFLTHN